MLDQDQADHAQGRQHLHGQNDVHDCIHAWLAPQLIAAYA
jgi:hypothetical protein